MKTQTSGRAAVIDAVADVLRDRRLGHPLRVAVYGITSSGKSTFADELAVALQARGGDAVRVSMDSFHHRRAFRHRQGRMSGDGYYEDAYDLVRAAREMLAPLGPAGSLRYRDRIIDLADDAPVESWSTASPATVLIVDGSFLQRAKIRSFWDVVIYLQVEFDRALERGVAREAAALGGRDAARRAFLERYHAAGRRYLAEVDPLRGADIVIDNNDLDQPRLIRS
jgi:uridine kinase